MTTSADQTAALAYYASIGAALFPIPFDSKAPQGIISSWKHDHSADPAQWAAWHQQHQCNFGVVAFASRLITIDIDTKQQSPGAAWAMWANWCHEHGFAAQPPQVRSSSGGFHIYYAIPVDIDPATLAQRSLIPRVIDTRIKGFTVAAGSTYQGRPYTLLSQEPPYPAPAALIEHCSRRLDRPTGFHGAGTSDPQDVATVLKWMAERGAFDDYQAWVDCGFIARSEFGDDPGFSLWQLTNNGTATVDQEIQKWESFASSPIPGGLTIATLIDRARAAGCPHRIRTSTQAMFGKIADVAPRPLDRPAASDTVAQLAANAGASLIGQGTEAFAKHAAPVLRDFLKHSPSSPPQHRDFPTLPADQKDHPLFAAASNAIERIFGLVSSKAYKARRVNGPLAIIQRIHPETFTAIRRQLLARGLQVDDAAIRQEDNRLAELVQRETTDRGDWVRDPRSGEPQNDNSDNVAFLLRYLNCEIRFNQWLERAEIKGGTDITHPDTIEWPDWTYFDDAVAAKLRTRANRTHVRFRPAKDFLWESILAEAYRNPFDPAVAYLASLSWDGVPRLATWLTAVCGTPDDAYHRAVARNIIGGVVRRIRHPGCKHDTMAIFFGPQGTGKSTLASILAIQDDWFSDDVMLGDASKELVLSLAGKTVVEIGEMGMRGSANAAHIKAMVSRQVDRGRTAYARAVTERERRNIFFGTTNDTTPLEDPTGNRRFLPVAVPTAIDLDLLRSLLPQLYAEAAALESKGDTFAIPAEVWPEAAAHQEAARAETDMEILLQSAFAAGPYSQNAYVTAADLQYYCKASGVRGSTKERGIVMRAMGFDSRVVEVGARRERAWTRGNICRGVRYMVRPEVQTGRVVVVMQGATG